MSGRFSGSAGAVLGCVFGWGTGGGGAAEESDHRQRGRKGFGSPDTRHPGLLWSQMQRLAMPLISRCLDFPVAARPWPEQEYCSLCAHRELKALLWTPILSSPSHPFQDTPPHCESFTPQGTQGRKSQRKLALEGRSRGAGEYHAPEFPTPAPARLINTFARGECERCCAPE